MKTSITILLLSVLFPLPGYSQGENDQWIFGKSAHLTFRKGYPEIVNSYPNINTLEGSTSVSDASGNLLFYSDGNTVYNRNHEMMPHGDGLLGHRSSTSSAVVVPYPGQPRKYFLFCVDQNLSADNKGLSYSIIDMDLHYGYGDLSLKNKILVRNTDEKIAVTKQCNGKDFWVVVHRESTDSFLAYSITPKGLNPFPVLSLISSPKGERPEIGYLKFSPSGRLLVNAQTLAERLDIYTFDKKSGRISMLASDPTQYHRAKKKDEQTYYGVVFSNQENFLYVSTLEAGEIFQYNLKLHPSVMFSKRYKVAQLSRCAGGMQLAKDNRIYVSDGYESNFLHRIDEPGYYGTACNFRYRIIQFPDHVQTNIGLPTLIETSLNYYNLGQDLIIHNPSGFLLDAKISGGKYHWSTGDTTKTIRVSDTGGTYWVNVFDPKNCFYYTDTIRVLVFKKFMSDTPALKNLSFCSNSYTKPIPLKSKYSDITFLWINDNPDLGLPKSGRGDIPAFHIPPSFTSRIVSIKVYPLKQGYVGQESVINISIKPIVRIDHSSTGDVDLCTGEFFQGRHIKMIPGNALLKWYNDNPATGLADSGLHYLTVFTARPVLRTTQSKVTLYAHDNGCVSEPSYMYVHVKPVPVMEKLKDITMCSGEMIPDLNLKSDQAGTDFMIENPIIRGQYVTIQPDVLRMIKTPRIEQFVQTQLVIRPSARGCMGLADSFLFSVKPSPKADFSWANDEDDTGYFHSRVWLQNLSQGHTSYSWQYQGMQNSNDNALELDLRTNTEYPVSLSVVNAYGCRDSLSKTLMLRRTPMVYMPNAFTPNSDRHNDGLQYRLYGIGSHKLRIYNRWGECVFESTEANPFWDGSIAHHTQADGTFSWVMEAVDLENNALTFRGTLTLMR